MLLAMFAIFIVLLFVGFPIAHAIGMEAMIYMLANGVRLNAIPQKFYAGIDSFVLLAIPGFVMAGNLMNQGGMTTRIVNFSKHLFGTMRGGLGVANVVASMVFAGISGSATGDTASIGGILIPAMKKEGYDAEFSVGVTATSSCLAPIIPPSIPMIVAGSCAGLSVGKLFIAGAIPGIILGVCMIFLSIYFAYTRGYPRGFKTSVRTFVASIMDAFWALLLTAIILFGIMGGVFTPTEASIIAVVYAIIVGKFVYRELEFRNMPKIIVESMVTSASILVITGFASVFAWLLTTQHIPTRIASAIVAFSDSKWVLLLLINLLLLFVGMFMETISAILILFPILLKICYEIGMDPIQFCVMCVMNLVIGLCTPPVGVCLFLAANIGKISLTRAVAGAYPFILVSLLVLALVTIFPQITLFLPNLWFGN